MITKTISTQFGFIPRARTGTTYSPSNNFRLTHTGIKPVFQNVTYGQIVQMDEKGISLFNILMEDDVWTPAAVDITEINSISDLYYEIPPILWELKQQPIEESKLCMKLIDPDMNQIEEVILFLEQSILINPYNQDKLSNKFDCDVRGLVHQALHFIGWYNFLNNADIGLSTLISHFQFCREKDFSVLLWTLSLSNSRAKFAFAIEAVSRSEVLERMMLYPPVISAFSEFLNSVKENTPIAPDIDKLEAICNRLFDINFNVDNRNDLALALCKFYEVIGEEELAKKWKSECSM
ncbi:MAG: hypothetical protein ABIE74_00755 [Pseudomonadota bacterium]